MTLALVRGDLRRQVSRADQRRPDVHAAMEIRDNVRRVDSSMVISAAGRRRGADAVSARRPAVAAPMSMPGASRPARLRFDVAGRRIDARIASRFSRCWVPRRISQSVGSVGSASSALADVNPLPKTSCRGNGPLPGFAAGKVMEASPDYGDSRGHSGRKGPA